MVRGGIGILGYDSLHFVVEDLERSRQFYTRSFDFKEVARVGRRAHRAKRPAVGRLRRGRRARVRLDARWPQHSKAARYLKRHPAGVMSLGFRVKNLDDTMAFLEERGGTFLGDPVEDTTRAAAATAPSRSRPRSATSRSASSSATTTARSLPASSTRASGAASRPENVFGIRMSTTSPATASPCSPSSRWYRDVLGFEPFWEIKLPHGGRGQRSSPTARACGRS